MYNIRILIADDQILFAESLKTVIEIRGHSIKVVAIALNGKEAVKMAEIHSPDVILMDIRMPEMDGVQATKIIKDKFPHIKILILTTFDGDEYIYDALKNGATGYLLKSTQPSELISTIYNTKNDMVIISPMVAKKLAYKFNDSIKIQKNIPVWFLELSKREKQVLKLISNGLNNKLIAEQLYIAEQTVKNHVSIIYSKLDTHDRKTTIELVKSLRNLL